VLEEMSKKFEGTVYNNTLRTREGVFAVLEALEFVKKQESLSCIKCSAKLMKVA